MTASGAGIPAERLHNQQIAAPRRLRPAELVARLGAVQAQEYPFAKWALALRLGETATEPQLEQALDAGQILRTHVMRPTWHFVAAADIGWLLALTAARVLATMQSSMRRHALDVRLLTRATSRIERALDGHRHQTRAELRTMLARAGVALAAPQLSFVTAYAELERVICSGPRRGNQATYALISERAPNRRVLPLDESLAELTRRFFSSHGPATVRDFVWWSGLKTSDARRGLEMVGARSFAHDGLTYWSAGRTRRGAPPRSTVHLLPIYDEYLVAYRDRIAVPHAPVLPGGTPTIFQHALVIDGQIAGTWRTGKDRAAPSVRVTSLRPLTRVERRGIESAASRYGQFLGSPVSITIDQPVSPPH